MENICKKLTLTTIHKFKNTKNLILQKMYLHHSNVLWKALDSDMALLNFFILKDDLQVEQWIDKYYYIYRLADLWW